MRHAGPVRLRLHPRRTQQLLRRTTRTISASSRKFNLNQRPLQAKPCLSPSRTTYLYERAVNGYVLFYNAKIGKASIYVTFRGTFILPAPPSYVFERAVLNFLCLAAAYNFIRYGLFLNRVGRGLFSPVPP